MNESVALVILMISILSVIINIALFIDDCKYREYLNLESDECVKFKELFNAKYAFGLIIHIVIVIALNYWLITSTFFFSVGNEIVETNLIEEYKIIKGSTRTEITGNGIGMLTYYQMSITSDDYFIFYYMNDTNEIEREKVAFNFTITEIDSDESYYRIYEKITKQKACSKFQGCKMKETNYTRDYKLFVPKGTIQKSNVKLD